MWIEGWDKINLSSCLITVRYDIKHSQRGVSFLCIMALSYAYFGYFDCYDKGGGKWTLNKCYIGYVSAYKYYLLNRHRSLSLQKGYNNTFCTIRILQKSENIRMIFKNIFRKLNNFSDDLLIFYDFMQQ